MNVLSLFDGIGCLQIALQRANIEYSNYYASEINKDAIKVTQHHFPNTIQLGDVKEIDFDTLPQIDFISAGSPCQDISSLNKNRLGLAGNKSSLFYHFIKAKDKWPNADWLLENVKGSAASQITSILKRRPIKLDSRWIVPQRRPRLYWTSIGVNTLPSRSIIKLSDLLQSEVSDKYYQTDAWLKWWGRNKENQLAK